MCVVFFNIYIYIFCIYSRTRILFQNRVPMWVVVPVAVGMHLAVHFIEPIPTPPDTSTHTLSTHTARVGVIYTLYGLAHHCPAVASPGCTHHQACSWHTCPCLCAQHVHAYCQPLLYGYVTYCTFEILEINMKDAI